MRFLLFTIFRALSNLGMAVLIIAIVETCCLIELTTAICQWQVSLTSQSSPLVKTALAQNREPPVQLHEFSQNVFVNNMEKKEYWSFPYFLYLQVDCDGELSHRVGRTLASSGAVPMVTITHDEQDLASHRSNVVKYTLRGALVSVNESVDLPGDAAELDQPAWLVPLIFDTHTRVLPIYVETDSSGYEVKPTRQHVNIDGYHKALSEDSSEFASILGPRLPAVQQLPEAVLAGRPYEVMSVHGKTPTLVIAGIPMSLAVILTNNEFSTFEAIQVSLPGQTNACLGSPGEPGIIKQALALPDRILLNTPSGLYEGFGQYESLTDLQDPVWSANNGPSRCYREVTVSAQSQAADVHVLAIGESETRHAVFAAHVQSGISLDFQELTDDHGRGVCEVLNQTDGVCNVVSATASATWDRAFLVLIQTTKLYHIAAYGGDTNDSAWHFVSNFSVSQPLQTDADVELSSSEEAMDDASPLLLSGMTFSSLISSHLFLWGRRLLHSPDGGASLYILNQYTSDANITLFTVSHDTGFALLNQQDEIWYGILGESIVLSQLRPSSGYSLHVSSSFGWEESMEGQVGETLSIFFDLNNRLQELVASANSTSWALTLHKRTIPIGDIIEHQNYINTQTDETGVIDSLMTAPSPCPVDHLFFEFSNLQLYAGVARFEFGAPYVSFTGRLHTQESLRAYQAIVHSMKEQLQQATLEVDELKMYNPFKLWHQRLQPLMAYNDYVFQNKLPGSHIAISPLEYFKVNDAGGAAITATMPEEIFLDRQESLHFAVYLAVDTDYRSSETEPGSLVDLMMISLEVSDQELLEVTTAREAVHLNSSVKYQVILRDRGSLLTQSPTGVDLKPVTVLIQVWGSPFKCFTQDDGTGTQLKGTSSLSVQLGCPPGRHLVFDISATLDRAQELYDKTYDCPEPDAKYPCFYYMQGFSPVFRVLDLATGDSRLFTGQYMLSVIGGSIEDPANAEYFSNAEVQQYNQQNGSGPLIWKPEDASSHGNGSVPIFQHDHSGILWRCEQGSPCASVPMNFPWPPEYYFVIQVTNREVDELATYCEYTTRFTIKVHGLDLSKYNLLAIVGWSLVVSVVIIIIFVLCHKHKRRAGQRRTHKRKSRVTPMPTIQEVEMSDDSEMEEVINIVEGRGFHDSSMDKLTTGSLMRVADASGSLSSTQQVPSGNPVVASRLKTSRL